MLEKNKIYAINYIDTHRPFQSYHGRGKFLYEEDNEYYFEIPSGVACFPFYSIEG